MMEMTYFPQMTLMAAFGAGFLSCVSPSVLPLVVSYASYITGLSIDQLRHPPGWHQDRQTILIHSLWFMGGLAFVFIVLGTSASWLNQWLFLYQNDLRKIGGALIILIGLSVLAAITLGIRSRDICLYSYTRPLGYMGSFLIGATVTMGWTPCVGPILSTIFLYAGTTEAFVDGLTLLVFYLLGLGLPLLAFTVCLAQFFTTFQQIRHYLMPLSIMSGIILVAVGGLLYVNSFFLVTSYLERWGIGWYVAQ